MEDGDDDFGDLYADVEVEATSAINIAPQFSKTQRVSDEFGKQDGDNDRACVSVDDDEDEDDDDDLDIVLNSDDDNIKRGEGFTIANLRSRELEDEDDDNLAAKESVVGNSRSLYKYLRSQSVASGSELKGIGCMYWQQMGSRSMVPQTARRFSLPRARNILDVNIDVFEQKPWKHPGADITDYFNFGFNEDSWKLYCNQVDEYRHRGPVSSGTPTSEPAQLTEEDRFQRNGQAIQVEDSIFERQSSMDVRRQLERDSDAIQINILDPEGTSVPEATNHGDVSVDDVTDHLSFSSASEDESVEEKYVGTDIYPPKARSGSENLEIHQVLTDETIRSSNDTKESNLVEESSEAGKKSANHSKSFEDDACFERRKAYTHDRYLIELTRSVKPDYHHSEGSNKSDDKRGPDESRYQSRRVGDNRKHGDRVYHERSNNPVYKSMTHKDFNLESHHENDYIISRRTYDKRKFGERRYHARHNNGNFPMSDVVHSTFRQRSHAFDPYNEENISNSKSEVPSEYYGERFSVYEDWDTDRFGANMNRTILRNSEEDEYYDERRTYKGEIDEFYLDPEYYDDTHGEKFRSFTYNGRKRDDVEYTRWEFRGPGRNNRRVNLEALKYYDDTHGEKSRYLLKDSEQSVASRYEQSFASRKSEESQINNCRWDRNMMPKSSSYRSRETYRGQYFEPFDREDYMIEIDDRVDMRRKGCHWQSEIQWEDEFMFRHEDAKLYAHRNSFTFEKVSRRKRFVSEPDTDHVEELIDDPYVVDGSGYVKEVVNGQHANRCRYNKQKNEVFNGNKCSKAYGKGRARLPLSSRNSPLVVGEVKTRQSSEKHKKPERMDLYTCVNDKMVRADETKATDEALDIEEGQILTEQVKMGPMLDETRAHVNGPHNENGKSGFDSTRILEAMAKMEKRRARFNEPIAITRKDSDSSSKVTVVDSVQETGSNKQQRPARKRRWGASNN